MHMQKLLGDIGGQSGNEHISDTGEQIYISSLALLKMLTHGRAGVPFEVMGLMLGEFIDDYTVHCIDVFSMPQTGSSVSVEAVDPVFQTTMLDMLKQTGRFESVIGWYHSHPGFGCWFSGTDINTQQSFEQLNPRAVGVVVDPIQSVKGKVVIDCFRLINSRGISVGNEPRQTTSNIGFLNKPVITALIHGLNRHYYSIVVNYRKNELEQKMLLNLRKKTWESTMTVGSFSESSSTNNEKLKSMVSFSEEYRKQTHDRLVGGSKTPKSLEAGKIDPKKRLLSNFSELVQSNIIDCLDAMLNTLQFTTNTPQSTQT